MKLNVDETQNKWGVQQLDITPKRIALFTAAREIVLNPQQVNFRAAIYLDNEEMDPLTMFGDSFSETSAAETFSTFRSVQRKKAPVCVRKIDLTFATPEQTYIIPMEGLFDWLADMLKENIPFAKVSYTIENDKPQAADRLQYAAKLSAELDAILKKDEPKIAPASQANATEKTEKSSAKGFGAWLDNLFRKK